MRPGSARPGTAQSRQNVAFGRTSYGQGFGNHQQPKQMQRHGSFSKPNPKQPILKQQATDLNKDALEKFDKLNKAPEFEEKMEGVDTGKQAPI